MKKTAKVFIWIGMICQFYLVYPIVVGVIALNKLNEARKKEEILTMGILTLLFCNTVGGIIMLAMSEKDFSQNEIVDSADIVIEKVKDNSHTLLHRIFSLIILGVVLTSYIFSMMPLINYGDAYVPFILTLVLIGVSVVLVIVSFSKKKNNKIFAFTSLVVIGLSIAVIILSILHTCGFALIKGDPFNMPDLDVLIGCMVCSGIIIVMASVLFFTSIIKRKEVVCSKDENLTGKKSVIERELEEVKELFEKGLLNEQDYNLAKQEIIKKYYN